MSKKQGHELFIVDNSDEDWKVQQYLYEWCDIANSFDIATGYFEIGALLALDGKWQQLKKIRLLIGDEVSRRTKRAFEEGLAQIVARLDDSLEAEKDEDDFLSGVPAIVEALRSGQIEARVYRKKKFHAKAYITHSKFEVVGSAALVGSSNFTYPGLQQNIELNIQVRDKVDELQDWFEEHWELAEDVTPDLLKTIERHTREYSPFDVYAIALTEYFRGHELTVGEWERKESTMYQTLDHYQREGYQSLMKIADKYGGGLLCDGVGLGKTFIGLMVIERLLYERKRVALIVPKAARKDVWEAKLSQYLPKALRLVSTLFVYNHTDLLRGGKYEGYMQEIEEDFDAIIIDEAHHFRNLTSLRAQRLYDMAQNKQMFFLTATPINNSLYDLMHLIEYFSRRKSDYFSAAPLGISTLRGHFRKMETALDALVSRDGPKQVELDQRAAEEILAKDDLFQALVVQRSRAYVKRSLQQTSTRQVSFPNRHDPQVAEYSLEKTYGGLLENLREAFNKKDPLVTLPIYHLLNYEKNLIEDEVDAFEMGRQKQIVALIRTLLLKRFESSAVAFQASCEDLLVKLLYFLRENDPTTAKRWERQYAREMEKIWANFRARWPQNEDEESLDEDFIPDEFKKKIEKLNPKKYDISRLSLDTSMDMHELVGFLKELFDFDPSTDDKLQSLINLLTTHPILKKHKVIIFTEYVNTARYLAEQLTAVGLGPLDEVDSLTKRSRSDIVRNFAPYYNNSSSPELAEKGITETRILISTDVLAEGLNLQDATCIINYDLHWNPVRLMQRIGRVDRRLDPDVEAQMVADNPEVAEVRGTAHIWNFLPPTELNQILSLYERVTHKTLRISKTFGIEGRKLLTPQDEFDALRNFNEAYEGTTTSVEEMRLVYQQLLRDHPDLTEKLAKMPLRVFSGKAHIHDGAKGVFFCYRLPDKNAKGEWADEVGFTRWYYYDMATEEIEEDATRIYRLITCEPTTPRQTESEKEVLTAIRRKLDKHIKNSYLKKVLAPVGIKSTLMTWLELV